MKASRIYISIFGLLFSCSLAFYAPEAKAYPDFIAFGYASCLTCHHNAAGGGPLSDYGRALWAAEIAARPFWSKKTDDQLGESSGFAGRVENTPWWLKPYAKYRGLNLLTSPGEKDSQNRVITMQADLGLSVLLDPDAKWLLSGGIGYVPSPKGASTARPEESKNIISREWYLRRQLGENQWLYTGFLDKVFGLRIADHTTYARRLTATAQNDQGHGLMWYRQGLNSDLFFQLSAGNLFQKSDLREPGASFWYEHSVTEKWRLGTSAYYGANEYATKTQAAVFTRVRATPKDSFTLETGIARAKPKFSDTTNSLYTLARGMMQLTRGYHFLSQAEFARDNMVGGSPVNLRWGIGFFAFPMQRVEIETQYVITRTLTEGSTSEDAKALLIQLHLSL